MTLRGVIPYSIVWAIFFVSGNPTAANDRSIIEFDRLSRTANASAHATGSELQVVQRVGRSTDKKKISRRSVSPRATPKEVARKRFWNNFQSARPQHAEMLTAFWNEMEHRSGDFEFFFSQERRPTYLTYSSRGLPVAWIGMANLLLRESEYSSSEVPNEAMRYAELAVSKLGNSGRQIAEIFSKWSDEETKERIKRCLILSLAYIALDIDKLPDACGVNAEAPVEILEEWFRAAQEQASSPVRCHYFGVSAGLCNYPNCWDDRMAGRPSECWNLTSGNPYAPPTAQERVESKALGAATYIYWRSPID